jgi:hypothetical protein
MQTAYCQQAYSLAHDSAGLPSVPESFGESRALAVIAIVPSLAEGLVHVVPVVSDPPDNVVLVVRIRVATHIECSDPFEQFTIPHVREDFPKASFDLSCAELAGLHSSVWQFFVAFIDQLFRESICYLLVLVTVNSAVSLDTDGLGGGGDGRADCDVLEHILFSLVTSIEINYY